LERLGIEQESVALDDQFFSSGLVWVWTGFVVLASPCLAVMIQSFFCNGVCDYMVGLIAGEAVGVLGFGSLVSYMFFV